MGLTADRVRQLRGLVLHTRGRWDRILTSPHYSRGLLGPLGYQQGRKGRCCWCQRTTQGRRRWHLPCVDAYRLALGSVVGHDGAPVLPRQPCPCGEPGMELDHRDAMAMAFWSGDRRRILRSHTLGNLQWLCRNCHADKTRSDLAAVAELKRGQVCLSVVISTGAGRARQTLEGRRMHPRPGWATLPRATLDPREVTCPRCLHRMGMQREETERWHLDEAVLTSGLTLDEWSRNLDERGMEPLPGFFQSVPGKS